MRRGSARRVQGEGSKGWDDDEDGHREWAFERHSGRCGRQTHASVASLALAVHLRPNERSTSADTQVLLQTGRDAIADAQRELTAADDADEQQWAIATPIVDRAAAEISGLARAGVSRLTRGDLERLTALEADLARVEQELGR